MLRKLIPQSTYARNVITLMTGTAFAQALPIAVSPILTRLYSPAEFGVFAMYLAVASILGVLVTGRYELAILIPKQDRDAIHIAALSAALSVLLSGLLLLLRHFTLLLLVVGARQFTDFWNHALKIDGTHGHVSHLNGSGHLMPHTGWMTLLHVVCAGNDSL